MGNDLFLQRGDMVHSLRSHPSHYDDADVVSVSFRISWSKQFPNSQTRMLTYLANSRLGECISCDAKRATKLVKLHGSRAGRAETHSMNEV